MRIEGPGDRDGLIDRRVARLADAEIDDQILDHEPFSRLAAGPE
jgi:hypothetical protein